MKAGWKLRTLGEVCSFENGDRGENYPSKSIQTSSGVPFINAGHLTDAGIDMENMNYIPRERFILLGNGKIQRGDILFCLRGSLGKCASVGDLPEGAIASSLVIVRAGEHLRPDFLLAYFNSDLCSQSIELYRNGAAQPNLSAGNLSKFQIPVPPLSDQQRIVAILDEAFDGIATAKANAEKNLQNAREVFDNYLESLFSYDTPGVSMRTLGDIATFRNGINYTKQSRGESVRVIGVKDFQKSFWAPMEDLDSVTLDGCLPAIDAVKVGDILSVRSNGNPLLIGRCILVPEHEGSVSHSGFTIRIRLHTDAALPHYVCHFLKSQTARRELIAGGNGANIKSLNQGTLAAIQVPVPQVPKQQAVVKLIEAMTDETNRLEEIYRQKLTALDELKQSLLHRAFNGNL